MTGTPEELVHWLFNQDKDKLYVVEEYKEKRGLRANSYWWTLIGKIAIEMNISKEEVYREYLERFRELGIKVSVQYIKNNFGKLECTYFG